MLLQRTFEGLEGRLKPGAGRFGSIAFLLFWLCFWVAGEVIVGGIMLWGGWSLLTGQPPGAGRAPLELAPALCCGLFLLGWLAFWTLGGVMAGHEVLRLLFGNERLMARPDAFELERHFGLFRRRQRWPRVTLRRFYLTLHRRALAVETRDGTMELTSLGTAEQREQLAAEFNRELGLSATPSEDGLLPKEWQEQRSPEGETILVESPDARRKIGCALLVAAALFAMVDIVTLTAAVRQPSLGVLGVFVTAGLLGFAWGAHRLLATRDEWILSTPGTISRQSRSRGKIVHRFNALALHLVEEKDSDGDPWYRLLAAETNTSILPTHYGAPKPLKLWSRSGDPTDVRNLALGLAHRGKIPFFDHTTIDAKHADFAALTKQLAESGRLGRWAARVLEKAGPR